VKVVEIVKRLLPGGSQAAGKWDKPPVWPPDLFAVTATIINQSGVYARSRYMAHHPDCAFEAAYLDYVIKTGGAWRSSGAPPDLLADWQRLTSPSFEMTETTKHDDAWLAAFRLLAIADEASQGVGFAAGEGSKFATLLLEGLKTLRETGRPIDELPHLPSSLCVNVPPTECCVLPKTRTPQVGCTIRGLSHNLALLPAATEVKSNWLFAGESADRIERPLNLLLVPLPADISGSCFSGSGAGDRATPGFVTLRQDWLPKDAETLYKEKLRPLIERAKEEVGTVNAVVLPEAAMTEAFAEKIGHLIETTTDVEIFITGAMGEPTDGARRNFAYAEIFFDNKRATKWSQKKHHRWRIDQRQVKKYHLGNFLGHKETWWENIDVSNRECFFYVIREGASLAVLICEDLARVDPVQTVVRAIGPNLVIALLMDDVQMERRWPGRYATMLADDPGSAILTLTSLGLIKRAQMPASKAPRYIALWKEPFGEARELELPDGAQALLLTLSPMRETSYTVDGRPDSRAVAFTLTAVTGVTSG